MAKVVGFELNCQDPEKAAEFYSKVFGWEIEEPKWGYRPVHTEENQNQTINGESVKDQVITRMEPGFR